MLLMLPPLLHTKLLVNINWPLCGEITCAPQQLECGNMHLKNLGSQTNNVGLQSFKEDI